MLAAAWAYTMANMDAEAAGALIPAAAGWVEQNLLRDGEDDRALLARWAAGQVFRDLGRWGIDAEVYEASASLYTPADAPPLPGLPTDGPLYRRTVWGNCTFETLPPERRRGLTRWSSWVTAGLYWTDGIRPLPAVERLARAETGAKPGAGLEKAFETCVEAGTMVKEEK
jgi:hypothetical protein